MKRNLFVIAALSAVLVFSGCSSADDNTSEDVPAAAATLDTQSENQEAQATQEQENEHQDQTGEEDNVYEMAKTMHIATATYLTMKGIDGEEIPEDFDLNEMKYVFQEEGYLKKITCDLSEIDVTGVIHNETYSVETVSVTYNGITMTYPDSDRVREESENSEIAKFIEEKLSEHNWTAGMSEAEFKAATPDVTYTMDADMSLVTETFTMKKIVSDTTFDFDGHKAYISADFTDDSLTSIGYKIEFNEGSRVDTPAHDYYTELSFNFYDKFGNPESQEDNPDSILSTYLISWRDAGGTVSMQCLEREPSLVLDYSGTVHVTLYFFNAALSDN